MSEDKQEPEQQKEEKPVVGSEGKTTDGRGFVDYVRPPRSESDLADRVRGLRNVIGEALSSMGGNSGGGAASEESKLKEVTEAVKVKRCEFNSHRQYFQ